MLYEVITQVTDHQAAVSTDQPDVNSDQESVAVTNIEADSTASAATTAVEQKEVLAERVPAPSEPPAEPVAEQQAPEPEPEKAATAEISEQQQQMLDKMFDDERCIGCDLSGLDLSNRDMGGFDRNNFV